MKISSPHREAWPRKPKSRSLEGGAQCASAWPDGEQTEHNNGAETRHRKTAKEGERPPLRRKGDVGESRCTCSGESAGPRRTY